MGEKEKALLKCLEALSSMASQVAVWVGDRVSEREAEEFNRAYGKWNAAYRDLKRAMEMDE